MLPKILPFRKKNAKFSRENICFEKNLGDWSLIMWGTWISFSFLFVAKPCKLSTSKNW
jgi:hypothetical protein